MKATRSGCVRSAIQERAFARQGACARGCAGVSVASSPCPNPPSFSLLANVCPNSDDDVDAVDCDVAVQSYDRIHPTAAGYSLMAGAWASAISDHVPME